MPELNKRLTKLEQKVAHLESLNTPGQENETRSGPDIDTTKEGNSTPRQPLLIPQIPSTSPNSKQPNNPWYKTLQGWKTVAELFIVIPFGVIYAIVTYCQWQDLKHNFTLSERAYLSIGSPERIAGRSPFAVLKIPIENRGHIPSSWFKLNIEYQRIRRPIPSSQNVRTTDPSEVVIAHNKITETHNTVISPSSYGANLFFLVPTLSPADVDALNSGIQALTIGGSIEYDTGFHKTDTIGFCYQFDITSGWIICLANNTTIKLMESGQAPSYR